jgi:hypothetical protein
VTALPADIPTGQTIHLDVRVQTPDEPGKYLLVIELFSGNFDWFSRTGVLPAIVDANIRPNFPREVGNVDLSSLYTDDTTISTSQLSRFDLWRAALRMFVDHPFGAGPNNYRLLYGKYLGATRWDTNIHANNLGLELLTGSGVLGLLAFVLIPVTRRWAADPPSIAVGVSLVHGLVDYFLMTTPLYIAFWILVGIEPRRHGGTENAPVSWWSTADSNSTRSHPA